MHSCLYEGRVSHRRFSPRPHAFDYKVFYAYLDLDELDEVFAGRWLWSTRRPAPVRFARGDHFGAPEQPLKQAVIEEVQRSLGLRLDGPVRMLTHLRHFGLAFNPVSFYYCFDQHGGLEAVVAEVSNTPWGERHLYSAACDPQAGSSARIDASIDKGFHVSPFMPMNVRYHWSLGRPAERLGVYMENRIDGRKIFDAGLSLRARPIDARHCASALVRFPFMSAKVLAAIYWQALKLWRKGTPVYPHPAKTEPPPRPRTRLS